MKRVGSPKLNRIGQQAGFTLMELLVVIFCVGVLVVLVLLFVKP